jgi:hypothetical protein
MRMKMCSEGNKKAMCNIIMTLETDRNYVVAVGKEVRNLEQNARLHVILGHIAAQVEIKGNWFSATVWKRLLTAAYLREKGEKPLLIPAIDNSGELEIIYEKTSHMSVPMVAELITYCQEYADSNGVFIPSEREEDG